MLRNVLPSNNSQESPVKELESFLAKSTLSIKKWSLLIALLVYSCFTIMDLLRFPVELYTITIPLRLLFVLLPLALSVYVHWTKPILYTRSYSSLNLFVYFNAGLFHILIFAYAKFTGDFAFPELGFILVILFGCLMTALPIVPTAAVSGVLLVIMYIINSLLGSTTLELGFHAAVYAAVMVMCLIISASLQRVLTDNHNMIRQFYDDSITDRLTGLKNSRYFIKQTLSLINQAKTESKEVSLIIIDIDNFKEMNDNFGHAFGDSCLAKLGDILRSVCKRPLDFPCRFAGDEFMVVMYDATEVETKKVCQDILTDIQLYNIEVSIGSATSRIDKTEPSMLIKDRLFEMADKALYKAKENGRNNFYSAVSSIR